MDYAQLAPGPEGAVERAMAGAAAGISVLTSGSTGDPREVLLSREALAASAAATHDALAGPGAWLLALPADRIAGAMVLVRAAVAGTPLSRMPPGPFTPEAFDSATQSLPLSGPRYVSLVPTQLHRLVHSPVGRSALASYDAVLVGGAALAPGDVPAAVVATYGATETAGGCVYDGRPIGATRVEVRDGVVRIAGPSLAVGYADGDDSCFTTEDGVRWLVTSDVGEIAPDGRLRILGRADDVIVTGGVNVAPVPVEGALAALPWVGEAVVVGVPDAEWGEAVVAVVAPRAGMARAPWAEDRARLADVLERAQLPRAAVVVDALPRLSSGKIDRAQARRLAAAHVADQGET